jgi:arylsulfatase A-like enzyme
MPSGAPDVAQIVDEAVMGLRDAFSKIEKTMSLPRSLGALLVALALASCGDEPRRPNLVVIAIDTLRPDHLGCYGSPRATSPNLDRFAQGAVVFENAQSAAPWTAPSLLSLMTSLYPSVHGVTSFPEPGAMNERVTTLAEVLKSEGYATAAFTDGGYAKAQFGLGQGFDYYLLNDGDFPGAHASNLQHPSRLRPNLDQTLRWLEEYASESFFLFFHTYEVHGPYQPPEDDVRAFRPEYDEAHEHERLDQVLRSWVEKREIDAAGVQLILAHQEHCGAGNGPERDGLPAKLAEFGITSLNEQRMAFWRDLYDAEIRHTDRELARLLERLDRDDLRENTIVVFVSDHGEGFGEHGLSGHGNSLHEEGLRVLLMLRAPGIAPRRVKDLVGSIDVMPTVLDLLGVSREKLMLQGRSVAPLVRGEPLEPAARFGHALSRKGQEGRLWSVREGRWRYVWSEQSASGQLFDLESDPQELQDASAREPKIAERLLGLLRAQRDVDATFRERASGPAGVFVPDEATLRELRKLGYVDGEHATDPNLTLGLDAPRLGQ